MPNQNSILDKLIESQEIKQAAQFNPIELVADLLKNLSTKESDILSRRYGLLGKKRETLEQIGKYYDITRERIRQIEMATVKKLKDLKNFRQEVENAEQHITRLLENNGGIMEEKHLLGELNYFGHNDESHNQSAHFILSNLLNHKIETINSDSDLLTGWKLPLVPTDLVKQVINELTSIIEDEKNLIKLEKLVQLFQQREFYKKNHQELANLKIGASEEQLEQEIDKILHSYLRIAKNIDHNILGEWGLSSWQTVLPKRMSDKVYLILRKIGKPLHFTEITNLINETGFDKKIAYPATIHNELILDDRFVLVGRGIYALKEWGYQPGTVIDIIVDILKKAEKPLTKEEIIKEVLGQRIVRKSTIYLALTNKEKIKKLPDGTYTLNQ
jgi:hypothetical protein